MKVKKTGNKVQIAGFIGRDGKVDTNVPAGMVEDVVKTVMQSGDIILAVSRMPNDTLAVAAFEPPSNELIDILESLINATRVALDAANLAGQGDTMGCKTES